MKKFLMVLASFSLAASNAQQDANDLTADGVFDMVVTQTMQNCNQFGNYTATNQKSFNQASSEINQLLGYSCVANGSCQNPQTTTDAAVSCDSPYNDDSSKCQACLKQFITHDCSYYTDIRFLLLPIGFKNTIASVCGNGPGSWFCSGTDNPINYTMGCYYGLSSYNVPGYQGFKATIDTMYYKYLNNVQTYINNQLNLGNLNGATPFIQQDFTSLYATYVDSGLFAYATKGSTFQLCFNDTSSNGVGSLSNFTSPFNQYIVQEMTKMNMPLCSAVQKQGWTLPARGENPNQIIPPATSDGLALCSANIGGALNYTNCLTNNKPMYSNGIFHTNETPYTADQFLNMYNNSSLQTACFNSRSTLQCPPTPAEQAIETADEGGWAGFY